MALVSATASSMSRTLVTVTVGPKVSSCTAAESSGTSTRTVGCTKRSPTASGAAERPPGRRGRARRRCAARMTSSWRGHRDRADLGVRAVVGAQRRAALLGEPGEELVVDPLVDVDPLDADAGLAGVGAGAPQRGVGGGVEVGVVVDDQRVLAAGLDQHRGQGLGAGGHHLLAGRGRAGEGDLVDARRGTARRRSRRGR